MSPTAGRIPASFNAPRRKRCDAEWMPMRCLIVDDNPSFLEAARVLLEREGLTVAGVASTCAEALRQVEALRPDIILVDISLGAESGFDVARRVVENHLDFEAAIVLISTHAEEDVADLIAASPAVGFLPKAELSASAIREIVAGRSS
jgi:DNA-binding NarL/FixJ family response regulator